MSWCWTVVVAAALVVGVEADEPKRIAVGQTATDEATGIELKFVGVDRDSRCPRDVTCVVAGEAVTRFEVARDADVHELILRVPPAGGAEEDLGELTISVVELEPQTESRRRIDASEYVATVVIAVR